MAVISEMLARLGLDASEFTGGIDSAIGRLDSFSGSSIRMGASLSAALTIPLAAIGGVAIKTAIEFDQALDTIRARTGATGTAMESLGASFRTVFAAVPGSAETATKAIAGLNVGLGLTGEPLNRLSTQLVNVSSMLGQDIDPLVRGATQLFNNWGIAVADQSSTLDFFWKTAQKTGSGMESLLSQVADSGPLLRAMGFSLEDSTVLLGKFDKEGIQAEMFVKSFSVALAKMAKEGITDPSAALEVLTKRIKEAGTQSEATGMAVELFGSRAGPRMAAAIREGRFEIEELKKSILASDETIAKSRAATMSFSDQWEQFGKTTRIALEPLGTTLLTIMSKFVETAKPLITWLGDAVTWFGTLDPLIQGFGIAVGIVLAGIGPLLLGLGAFAASLSALAGPATMVISTVKNVAFALTNNLSSALTTSESSLLSFGKGIGYVALAVAAYKLGSMIEEHYKLNEAIDENLPVLGKFLDLIAAAPAAVLDKYYGATEMVTEAQKRQLHGVENLEAKLKAHGIAVRQGSMSLEEYAEHLGKLAREHAPKATKATVNQTKAGKALAEQVGTAKEGQQEYNEILKEYHEALFKIDPQHQKHFEKLTQIRIKTQEALEAQDLWNRGLVRVGDSLIDIVAEGDKLTASLAEIAAAEFDVSKAAGMMGADLLNALGPSKTAADSFGDAMSRAGIKTSDSVHKAATDAQGDFQDMALSGIASAYEIQQAYVKALQAIKAERLATGGIWSQVEEGELSDALAGLDRMESGVKAHVEKQKSLWGSLGNQISTIFTDLSKGIADVIFEGKGVGEMFKGIFEEAGKAVLRFVIEFLEGKLLKVLGNLLDSVFPSMGKALGGLFGGGGEGEKGGGGVGGAVGEVTGGLGGGGGGMGSMGGATAIGSMFGPVGMAIGAAIDVGTAIMGVVGGMRREGTLNAIEENTRFGMIFQLATLDQANTYLPYLRSIHERWAEFLSDHAWRIHDVWEVLGQLRDMVRDSIVPPIGLMALAGAPTVNVYVTLDGKQLTAAVATEIVETLRSGGQQL